MCGFALLLLPYFAAGQSVVRENPAWNKEPDSFHGVKFGATESEVQANLHPWLCGLSEELGTCYFKVELAGRSYDAIASFLKHKLSEVFCLFDENDFPAVKDVLVLAYGDPTRHSDGGMTWIGSSVTAALDHSLPPERKSQVDQIALKRSVLKVNDALDAHRRILELALELSRRTHDQRDYDRIAKDASSTYESDKASAAESLDKFRAGGYGSLSVALNSYIEETAKRKDGQKMKDAAAIR
jgi:hypothetical protein